VKQRIVLRTTCDDYGRLAFLFGAWGAVDRDTALDEIDSGTCEYLLVLRGGDIATMVPEPMPGGRGLIPQTTSGERLHADDPAMRRMGR
jgi:hypothetical protein